jgi:hypothetical protein
VHAEFARFVIACGQDAAPIARATDPNRFSTQSRPVAHFDRRVKAVHVEMNDRAGCGIRGHAAM